MYTILLNNDNTFTVSHRERIMQRSKLVDKFHILVEPLYNEFDMKDFTAVIKYLLPISKRYKSEVLELSTDLYKDRYEYVLPFDTGLTTEDGDVEFTVTFTKVEMDAEGNGTQYVRTTDDCSLTIVPISKWDDVIPDEALNAVEQKIVELSIQAQKLADAADIFDKTKADNIGINEDGSVQLKSHDEWIGNGVNVAIPGTIDDEDQFMDGVVDLDSIYTEVQI